MNGSDATIAGWSHDSVQTQTFHSYYLYSVEKETVAKLIQMYNYLVRDFRCTDETIFATVHHFKDF